jgi:hypothetical protein
MLTIDQRWMSLLSSVEHEEPDLPRETTNAKGKKVAEVAKTLRGSEMTKPTKAAMVTPRRVGHKVTHTT